MKHLKIGILALFAGLLVITGCSKKVTYTVTFDSQGGSAVASAIVEQGKTVVRPNDPTKSGSTFVGWFINLDDTTPYDFNTKVTGDMTLKAKWSSGSGNGGTSTTTKSTTTTTKKSTTTTKKKTTKATVSVTGVTLNKTSLTITEGNSETLTATVAPSKATNKKVTWSSSDKTIATVDSNGKVTAVKAGTVTITVKTENGNKTATATITVKEKAYTFKTSAITDSNYSGFTCINVYYGNSEIKPTAIKSSGSTKTYDNTLKCYPMADNKLANSITAYVNGEWKTAAKA